MILPEQDSGGTSDKWGTVVIVCGAACFVIGVAVKLAFIQHWI